MCMCTLSTQQNTLNMSIKSRKPTTTVSIRLTGGMLDDINEYKSKHALKFQGSRSKAIVSLIGLALYETDTSSQYVTTHSFNRKFQNLVLIVTMVLLFLSVSASHLFNSGSISWTLFTLIQMTVFGFCALLLAEEVIVRVKT